MPRDYKAIQVITAGDWNEVKALVENKEVALRMAQTRGDIVRIEECPGSGWEDWAQIIFRDAWTRVPKSQTLLVVPLRHSA